MSFVTDIISSVYVHQSSITDDEMKLQSIMKTLTGGVQNEDCIQESGYERHCTLPMIVWQYVYLTEQSVNVTSSLKMRFRKRTKCKR